MTSRTLTPVSFAGFDRANKKERVRRAHSSSGDQEFESRIRLFRPKSKGNGELHAAVNPMPDPGRNNVPPPMPKIPATLLHRQESPNDMPAPTEATPKSTKFMLLTGASRGIGHATVKLFQENGWRIFTVSRQPFSEECRWPSARESHIQADLADLTQVDALIEEVRRRLPDGELHALVNNAGISPKGPGGSRLGVIASDADVWTRVMNVNLISTALLARGLLPELEKAQGSIVNVTSIAGSRVHPFAGVAYAASKAGLAALTRELAHEFGPRGVRANAIAPGEIETSSNRITL